MNVLCPLLAVALAATSAGPLQGPDGKALYTTHCRKCHGVLGTPPKTIQQKMDKIVTFDAAFAAKTSEEAIAKVLLKGGDSDDMKSFKDKMTPEEMRAVAAYVLELANRPRP